MALADTLGGVKVSLFLNHRCNLRCRYCYNGRHFDRAMPWDLARRSVDFGFEQAQRGFLLLSFFGGEPLIEIALLEKVVAHARAQAEQRDRRLFFALATNGTLLDTRRLQLIKAHGIRVQVSLDGCRRAQDANRLFINGRSTYRRAAASLVRLIGDGAQPRVVSVIDPSNLRYLVESFQALKDLGARNIYFVPNLHADWDEAARAQLESAMARLADRWAAGMRAGEDLQLDPFNGKVVAQLVRGARSPVRCAFGQSEYAISPKGRIYPCDRMVKTDEDTSQCLGDLDSGLDLAKRESLARSRERVDPECAGCEVRERCAWSCGCANHELTGDATRVSPTLCWFERTVIAQTDRVANALYAERDPTFMRRFYGSGASP